MLKPTSESESDELLPDFDPAQQKIEKSNLKIHQSSSAQFNQWSFGESVVKKSDSVVLDSEFIDHREIFNSAKVNEEEHDVYGKLKSIRFSLMNN